MARRYSRRHNSSPTLCTYLCGKSDGLPNKLFENCSFPATETDPHLNYTITFDAGSMDVGLSDICLVSSTHTLTMYLIICVDTTNGELGTFVYQILFATI